jgi:hypothetical protein
MANIRTHRRSSASNRNGVIVVARGYLGKVAENGQFAGPNDPDKIDLGEIRMQPAT